MDLQLVSFKLCPYVQRSVITLNHKGAAYDITYIDLDNKPDWFLDKSPLGLVPILEVDGKDVIFESAVINEFVNEVTDGDMHPSDPVRKAHNRAWIEFGSTLLGDYYMLTVGDAAGFEERKKNINDKLAKAEALAIGDGPFFNGDAPSLVDTAWAPFFMRLALVEKHTPIVDWSKLPKAAAWRDVLLGWDAVQNSVVPEFEDLFDQYLAAKGSHLTTLVA